MGQPFLSSYSLFIGQALLYKRDMSYISADEAIEKLKNGSIVALPSETVYGLAGRHDQLSSVQKIFQTKKRPSFDPLILHVSGLEQVGELAKEIPSAHRLLAEAFWPGPLTLIFDKSSAVLAEVTSGLETVAIRSPKHDIFQRVLQGVGVPLAAPSANQFSKTSPTQAIHVETEFDGNVAVVEGGACEAGLESTILQLQEQGKKVTASILRPGVITRQQIENTLSKTDFEVEFVESSAMAPGRVKAHYQPKQILILYNPELYDIKSLQSMSAQELNLAGDGELQSAPDFSRPGELLLSDQPALAARELYAKLRQLSESNRTVLTCPWPHGRHPAEAWAAIFDRLKRASRAQLI
jgi:L-threonylcarbamoyladenylate synthase